MPNLTLNNTGATSAASTLTGAAPASGNQDILFVNRTGSSMNLTVTGSSTNISGSIVDGTDAAAAIGFDEAERLAGEPIIQATVPAFGYLIFNAAKSDAGAGNLTIPVGGAQARHGTSSQAEGFVYWNELS